MDETTLAQQICLATQQLWMRGLMFGESGMITAQTHRRRYLVTPPGRRRIDLRPEDLVTVDVGGTAGDGEMTIDGTRWLPHRLAHQRRAELHTSRTRQGIVGATILANPPMTEALVRQRPGVNMLHLSVLPDVTIAVVDGTDESLLQEAIEQHQFIVLRHWGLLSTATDIATALNGLEMVEHAATVELTSG